MLLLSSVDMVAGFICPIFATVIPYVSDISVPVFTVSLAVQPKTCTMLIVMAQACVA